MSARKKAIRHAAVLQKHQIGGSMETPEKLLDLLFRKNPAAIDLMWGKLRAQHLGRTIFVRELVREDDELPDQEILSEDFTGYEDIATKILYCINSQRIRKGCELLGIPYTDPVLVSMPLGDANAFTFRSPEGYPIIAINTGLVAFLFRFSVIVARCFESTPDDSGVTQTYFTISTKDAVLEEEIVEDFRKLMADYGAYGYASDPVLNIVHSIERSSFPFARVLFSHLIMFVIAHEYAHIATADRGSITKGDPLQEEIDADVFSFNVCNAYIRSVSRFDSELAAPGIAAQVFFKLADLRGMVRSQDRSWGHPGAEARKLALLRETFVNSQSLFENQLLIFSCIEHVMERLWEEAGDRIRHSIATAPLLVQFSEETQQQVFMIASSLEKRPQARAPEDGAEDGGNTGGYSHEETLDTSLGLVRRLSDLINRNFTLSDDAKSKYERAFQELAAETNLSYYQIRATLGREVRDASDSLSEHLGPLAASMAEGKFPEAANHARQVISDIDSGKISVSRSINDMRALFALGEALHSAYRTDEAMEAFGRADRLCDAIGTPLDWLTINTMTCRSAQRGYKSAEALEMSEKLVSRNLNYYGERHTSYAEALNNHGLILTDLGRFAEAKDFLARALAIYEDRLTPDHIKVAILCNNLGLAAVATGQSRAAVDFHRRALGINLRAYGDCSDSVCRDRSNLGEALFLSGNHAEAEEEMRGSLGVAIQLYGESYPVTGMRKNNLAKILNSMKRFAEAKPLLDSALEISRAHFGEGHFSQAAIYSNLCAAVCGLGDPTGAVEMATRAYQISSDAYGMLHPAVARELCNLGSLFAVHGVDESLEDAVKLLELSEKVSLELGLPHAETLVMLAHCCSRMRDFPGAMEILKRALASLTEEADPEARLWVYSQLVTACLAAEKVDEALELMDTALDLALGLWISSGRRSPAVQHFVATRLALLAGATGDLETAKKLTMALLQQCPPIRDSPEGGNFLRLIEEEMPALMGTIAELKQRRPQEDGIPGGPS